jgi:hypothetical protein
MEFDLMDKFLNKVHDDRRTRKKIEGLEKAPT